MSWMIVKSKFAILRLYKLTCIVVMYMYMVVTNPMPNKIWLYVSGSGKRDLTAQKLKLRYRLQK